MLLWLRTLFKSDGDDVIDRLNHRYSVLILIILAIWTYNNREISCWTPAQFTVQHTEYTAETCNSQMTYFEVGNVTAKVNERGKVQYKYHKLVPGGLLVQAFLLYIPFLIWKVFSGCSDVSGTVHAAEMAVIKPGNARWTLLRIAQKAGSVSASNLITAIVYLVVKLFYFFAAGIQALIISSILSYGYIQANVKGNYKWSDLEELYSRPPTHAWFPNNFICDFGIRQLGHAQRYTVQCQALNSSEILDMYGALFLWFIFLTIANLASLVVWIVRLTCLKRSYMNNVLRSAGISLNADTYLHNYFSFGAGFIFRMVAVNAGQVAVNEAVHAAWQQVQGNEIELQELNDGTEIRAGEAHSLHGKPPMYPQI